MKAKITNRNISSIGYCVVIAAVLVFSTFKISLSSSNDIPEKPNEFQPVIETLINKGVDSSFINRIISDPNVSFKEKYVKINVVGTGSPPDYSSHYSSRAVRKSKQFLSENDSLLTAAENEYGIPKEVITSILYVETRHGNYLGNNNIVSVYLSTALANQPEYIERNASSLKETYNENSTELNKYLNKLEKRSNFKSNWAIDQLVALEEVDKLSPIPITEIEGSWAGAFGMSQFLPSSYLQWAVDGNGDSQINLFEIEDAVFSVANYLKTNGWGNTEKAKRKAVWHYNHSQAYVDAVLKLAELISE